MMIIIMGPTPTRGGGLNRGGRRKRLETEGDKMEGTHPGRGRGHFYDNIEC